MLQSPPVVVRRQDMRLASVKLPLAVRLLPDLQYADLDLAGLAGLLRLRFVEMPRNGGIARDRLFRLRELQRFDHRLARQHGCHELGLVLDPARRMAIAHVVGGDGFELGLVGGEQTFAERFDGGCKGRIVGRLGERMPTCQRGNHRRAGGSECQLAACEFR